MNKILENIEALRSQIKEKMDLEDQIPQLEEEKQVLTQQVAQLREIKDNEQMDVDKLESGKLAPMLYKLMGSMDEKMDKERQEAQDARDNFDSAAAQLDRLEQELASKQARLSEIQDCENQYLELMDQQIQELESQTTEEDASAAKLLQSARVDRSLRDALLHAQRAVHLSLKTSHHLQQARLLVRDDSDSSSSSEPPKSLASAQYYAEILAEELTILQAKLARMGIDPEPHLTLCDYLKAPAAFIVGTASGASQLDRINIALDQLDSLRQQLRRIYEKTQQALTQVEESILTAP